MGVKKRTLKIHHYVVGGAVIVTLFGGYIAWQENQPKPVPILTEEQIADQTIIDEWYGPLFPMMIDSIRVEASVASTTETRTKGLSGTPYLPEGVVKLFVFDESQEWSFWMKDMNYSIDIIWVDATGEIVFIEESVSPSSYPMSFMSNIPAKYVIETTNGFVKEYGIAVGERVVLPKGL